MRVLASLVALSAGAYAYAATMDKGTRKRWKRRLQQVNFDRIEDIIPDRRTMGRMRKRMMNVMP
ncbi:hypothetical protein [Evansella halocellulosilytica]|uniref:hypothetical protein n=1 Tax=Evansella halocellulosilytica TaxID=2011013 RepID=UPI000BB68670|nr:hypothetical protein [Evansella halocellulosilytica]